MGGKKRILHISKYYYPYKGGTEQIAQGIVRVVTQLEDSDLYEQKVICFDHIKGRGDSTDVIEGIEIIRCTQDVLFASQALGRTYGSDLRRLFAEFDPDIVVFHYPNPFVGHYLLKYISDKAKLIVWWHLDIYRQKVLKYFFYHQNRKLIQRADKIVATSPNYIDGSVWLSSCKDKCEVIPNCIDEEKLEVSSEERERAGEIRSRNEGKTICLAVGRHVLYKGYKYLIEASKLLDENYRIFIVGEGPLTDRLKGLAGSDEKIEFLGRIEDSELRAYLLACDIYTFPSITKNEAFGVSLAEGMYFGHPAVTFTIPGSGVNYVSLDGVTGIECPNMDVTAYADAIKKLSSDPGLRKEMGENARKRIRENFVFSKFRNQVSRLIRESES